MSMTTTLLFREIFLVYILFNAERCVLHEKFLGCCRACISISFGVSVIFLIVFNFLPGRDCIDISCNVSE